MTAPPATARHTASGGTTTGRQPRTGSQPADTPQFNVCPNHSRPGLVLFAIGSGTDPLSITPALAEALADELLAAAAAARRAGGADA